MHMVKTDAWMDEWSILQCIGLIEHEKSIYHHHSLSKASLPIEWVEPDKDL